MPRDLILPLNVLMGLTVYSLIAKWYLMPILRSLPRARALVPLLLFHSSRFIGLAFLIPGVTAQELDPRFANPAAYGDLPPECPDSRSALHRRRGSRGYLLHSGGGGTRSLGLTRHGIHDPDGSSTGAVENRHLR